MLHLLWMMADTGTTSGWTSLLPDIQQIGVGALIALPAYGGLWKLWQKLEKTLEENSNLRENQVSRERELSEKTIPILSEAVKILATAPDRFDQALNQANNATKTNELDMMMRRLQDALSKQERQ